MLNGIQRIPATCIKSFLAVIATIENAQKFSSHAATLVHMSAVLSPQVVVVTSDSIQ